MFIEHIATKHSLSLRDYSTNLVEIWNFLPTWSSNIAGSLGARPAGAKCDIGAQGPKGDAGEAGLSGSLEVFPVYQNYASVSIDAGESYLAFGGLCLDGTYSLSGSFREL